MEGGRISSIKTGKVHSQQTVPSIGTYNPSSRLFFVQIIYQTNKLKPDTIKLFIVKMVFWL